MATKMQEDVAFNISCLMLVICVPYPTSHKSVKVYWYIYIYSLCMFLPRCKEGGSGRPVVVVHAGDVQLVQVVV